MRRRVFNFLSAVSLVLCLATGGMWVRSYYVWDSIFGIVGADGDPIKHHLDFDSSMGEIEVSVSSLDYEASRPFEHLKREPQISVLQFEREGILHSSNPPHWGEWLGFLIYYSSGGDNAYYTRCVIFPYWFPSLLTAIIPGIWLWRFSRRRRIPPGRCTNCGYDIRATPEGRGELLARCPECGNESAATAIAR